MSNWKPAEASARQSVGPAKRRPGKVSARRMVGQVKRCANDNKVSHYDRSKILNTYNLNEHIICFYLLIR
jgi:hypothetical protein